MEKTFLIVAIILAGGTTYAQSTFPTDGSNVGIGTVSPAGNLHVNGSQVQEFPNVPAQVLISNSADITRRLMLGYDDILDAAIISAVQTGTGWKNVVINPNGGNVGIGTASPSRKLDVTGTIGVNPGVGNDFLMFDHPGTQTWRTRITTDNGSSYIIGNDYGGAFNTKILILTNTGNVGIGTSSPEAKLDVAGTIRSTGDSNKGLYISSSYSNTNNRNWAIVNNYDSWGQLAIVQSNSSGGDPINGAIPIPRLSINVNGNIGIGTTTPDQLLSVNGTIHSKEVLVNLTGFPDYVFKPTYHLLSLTEVKSYIDKNHHLPDMPSEAAVIKDGVNLGEMVNLQTKKIEELTLYLIDLKKANEKLKKQNNNLQQNQQVINQKLKRNHIN